MALLQERGEFTDLQLGELSNKFDREAYQNFPIICWDKSIVKSTECRGQWMANKKN